jgi:hypothetical protein
MKKVTRMSAIKLLSKTRGAKRKVRKSMRRHYKLRHGMIGK